ncbi:MAG: LuxR C-terminal-related transcriptional regulator [Clostridia bacterium]|nr:LuxR C-terminal-related transcriptional regulator [Clostridia bacterium]MDY6183977.1 LuxR C-terminal-related transcriptional regulator [Eubacteriales bacterium]
MIDWTVLRCLLAGNNDRDLKILIWVLVLTAVAGLAVGIVFAVLRHRRKAEAPVPAVPLPEYDMSLLREYLGLTARETEVLEQMLKGKDDVVIAKDLGIAHATVQGHIRQIYRKSDAQSFRELMTICRMCIKN